MDFSEKSDKGSNIRLPCVFFANEILCSFRKSEKSGVANRCLRCVHYKRFCDEIEKEEEAFFGDVDEIRKGSRRGGSGEQAQE